MPIYSALPFFILSFAVIYVAMKKSDLLNYYMSAFSVFLQKKAFPSYSEYEVLKFSILRIALGIVLILRSIDIQYYLIRPELTSFIGILSLSYLLLTILITIGLFTQYALILVVFGMWQAGDFYLGTSTLANDLGAMLAILLFLTNSGKYLSLDSKLISTNKKLSPFLLYSLADASSDLISLIKFAALTSYWAVCVYSLSQHLGEPAWMNGTAAPLLLTNTYMSSWHEFFNSLFTSNELFVLLAKCSMWLMMLWYFCIIPAILLGGIWRNYIIIWGLLFFTLSLTVLELGSLAEIEFIFWAAIFWTKTGILNKEKYRVFYDDKCNLCDKTIQVICKVDLFSMVKLKPISENITELEALQISQDSAMQNIHGVIQGETYAGYDFYLTLSKQIIILWPLYPIIYLGKILLIGPFIYAKVANYRIATFGVCTLPRKKTVAKSLNTAGVFSFQKAVVLHILVLSLGYFIYIPQPMLGFSGEQNTISKAAHYYGIAPIDVFNKMDLRMAENWFTLESIDYDELVPLLSPDGSRLEMHDSDRVYYGHTLIYRRGVIGRQGCFSQATSNIMVYLSGSYLTNKEAKDGAHTFKYTQYYQALPDENLLQKNKYVTIPKKIRCQHLYTVTY
jgi:predicted DCC family thiol-disulfide oxidoreductase YuxK